MVLSPEERLQQTFSFIIGEEDSTYSDTPGDKGGPTKYGVTLETWRWYCGDHSLTADDVAAITYLQAQNVFKKYYWGTGSNLPQGLDLAISDMAYNSGCKTATIILQRVVGAEPDGVIGPKTLAAVSHMPTIRAIQLYGGLCEDYYESLNNPVFIDGWLDRNVRRTKAALAMATK